MGRRFGAAQDRIEHTGTEGRGRTNHHGGYSGSVLVVTGCFCTGGCCRRCTRRRRGGWDRGRRWGGRGGYVDATYSETRHTPASNSTNIIPQFLYTVLPSPSSVVLRKAQTQRLPHKNNAPLMFVLIHVIGYTLNINTHSFSQLIMNTPASGPLLHPCLPPPPRSLPPPPPTRTPSSPPGPLWPTAPERVPKRLVREP